MKKNLDKYVAIFAVIVLIGAIFWWFKWEKKEYTPPVERKMMDSIDYHMKEAEGHAEIAREYLDQADKYAKIYKDTVIDPTERAELGAKIWDDAIRKADSLRQLTP